MAKIRVWELARELGMDDSKELLRIIRDMGLPAKTPSSGLTEDQARRVRDVVAPHIEQLRREAEEKARRREEAERARKEAEAKRPRRVIRVRKSTVQKKEALLERHRRKLAGETLEEAPGTESTTAEPLTQTEVAIAARATPPQEAAVEQAEATPEPSGTSPVDAPAPAEGAAADTREEAESETAPVKTDRRKALPPDQEIAQQFREQAREDTEAPTASFASFAVTVPPPPVREERVPREKKLRGGVTREIPRQQRQRRAASRTTHVGKRKKKAYQERKKEKPRTVQTLEIPELLTVADLAERLEVPVTDVIKYLLKQGRMVHKNQALEYEEAASIARDYGFEPKEASDEEIDLELLEEEEVTGTVPRPPVVTVLGHVDHGKTSLLDAIRKTNVTAGEAGGITQKIGAYTVTHQGRRITFVDTPGHEAFTQMRARGAQVTDLAVLVVAADDGVMPQTVEAINHARAAKVPILVAINKMDRPDANPDRVMQQLSEHGLIPEKWGGDTVVVPVSALQKTGLEDLLEMILLQADLLELKADPEARAQGTIIESWRDKALGPAATIIVGNGTLREGDIVVAGIAWGRIRLMRDEKGRRLKKAGPSMPVEILGLSDVPVAGDRVVVVEDEKKARQVSEARAKKAHDRRLAAVTGATTLAAFMQAGQVQDLNLIVKADGQGSLEALLAALQKLSTEEVKVHIIHGGVGAVSESDVTLASASQAMIVAFNVRPDPVARRLAEVEGVEIRTYRVIYNVIEDVEKAMKGLLAPEVEEEQLGVVEIRRVFKISKVGKVAGCYVREGKVTRDSLVRIVRDGIIVFEGKVGTLRRFKEDVREVTEGYECGLTVDNFNDYQEGDVIEAYRKVEVARASL